MVDPHLHSERTSQTRVPVFSNRNLDVGGDRVVRAADGTVGSSTSAPSSSRCPPPRSFRPTRPVSFSVASSPFRTRVSETVLVLRRRVLCLHS